MKVCKYGNNSIDGKVRDSKRSVRLLPILAAVGFVSAWLINPVLAQASPAASGTRALDIVEAEFEVKDFDVQGNTLFSPAQIKTILKPYLGPVKSMVELHNAARALQAAYHKAGHLITQVTLPEQEIQEGVVKFKVIEGRVSNVVVLGNQRLKSENILASMPVLKSGEALDLHDLHAGLLLANENPSRRLSVNFRPDKTPGEVIANVRVQEGDIHKFMASLNDTGNDNTGKLRLNLAWQNTNVMQKDHVATLQYTLAPDDLSAVSVLGGGYRIPFYRAGLLLDLVGAYSSVGTGQIELDTAGSFIESTGKGLVFGAQVTRLLPTVLSVQHRISASLYQRQYENECNSNTPGLICNDVTTRPLALSYIGQWSNPGSQVSFNTSASYNLSSGNNGSAADFNAERLGADNRYLVWRMGANISKQLPHDWQMRTGIEGQWVDEPLVSGDQFGIGGADSVRGVGERGLTGDKGWRANIEFNGPDLGAKTALKSFGLRPAIFLEGGSVTKVDNVDSSKSLASAGLGLRASYGGNFSAQIDWGRVIKADHKVDNDPEKGDSRFHFNLGYVF